MLFGLLMRMDAAIDDDREIAEPLFQTLNARMIERRNVPVFARAEAVEPGLARVNDQRIGAGGNDGVGKTVERFLDVLIVDAEPALDRDWPRHRRLHRRHAFPDQFRLAHQAGAEAAVLHAIGGAADIEIDFVIAEVGADPRRLRQIFRIAAAELQRHRMLGGIEAEQALARAMDDGVGRDHLRIEERMARELPVEEPAVPVRPFHHRGDAKAACQRLARDGRFHGAQMADIALFGKTTIFLRGEISALD